jgi:hypothetical protein
MVSFIWTICYLSVLVGLSAYGIHRYLLSTLFEESETRASAGGPIRAIASRDRATAHF